LASAKPAIPPTVASIAATITIAKNRFMAPTSLEVCFASRIVRSLQQSLELDNLDCRKLSMLSTTHATGEHPAYQWTLWENFRSSSEAAFYLSEAVSRLWEGSRPMAKALPNANEGERGSRLPDTELEFPMAGLCTAGAGAVDKGGLTRENYPG
jgi:hypothetical protein